MEETEILHELADQVSDEASFIQLVRAIRRDWQTSQELEAASPSSKYGPAALGWENSSLGKFLEAMESWSEDTRNGTPGAGGLPPYVVPENPWKRAAHILLAAKIYE